MPRVASDAAAHIGRQIAAIRVARGMTQDEVAAHSGIDSSNIRAYEKGRAMPSIHSLVRIAAVLDATPGELLEGLTPSTFTAQDAAVRNTAR